MFAMMIKALYTDVESFVNFNGVSTQAFPLYKGSGQGRILHLLCIRCTLTDLLRQFVTANTLQLLIISGLEVRLLLMIRHCCLYFPASCGI